MSKFVLLHVEQGHPFDFGKDRESSSQGFGPFWVPCTGAVMSWAQHR